MWDLSDGFNNLPWPCFGLRPLKGCAWSHHIAIFKLKLILTMYWVSYTHREYVVSSLHELILTMFHSLPSHREDTTFLHKPILIVFQFSRTRKVYVISSDSTPNSSSPCFTIYPPTEKKWTPSTNSSSECSDLRISTAGKWSHRITTKAHPYQVSAFAFPQLVCHLIG